MAEVDWRDIEVGKQYMFEHKYYIQAEVTVLDDISPSSRPDFKQYKLRVDRAYAGCQEGEILTPGQIADGSSYNMKFKTLDDMFDYVTTGCANKFNLF